MRSLAAGVLLFLAAGGGAGDDSRLEALRFNPRERTQSGLNALERGDAAAALERFEAASRLDPDNPITVFNTATASLIAGEEGASARLEEAIALAPEGLQPIAHYNLGNARLGEENPAAAIDAFKQALRLAPRHMEAKFNLEVAQRLLEQQQEQEQQNQDESQQQQDQEEQEQQDESQPDQEPDEEPQEEPGEEPEDQQGSGSQDHEKDRPLPDFEDQQDMTAEQAAAILEAVENLEREQRRQQAEERSRRRAKSGKDW
jgi:Ca-activated chloride channel family protein